MLLVGITLSLQYIQKWNNKKLITKKLWIIFTVILTIINQNWSDENNWMILFDNSYTILIIVNNSCVRNLWHLHSIKLCRIKILMCILGERRADHYQLQWIVWIRESIFYIVQCTSLSEIIDSQLFSWKTSQNFL